MPTEGVKPFIVVPSEGLICYLTRFCISASPLESENRKSKLRTRTRRRTRDNFGKSQRRQAERKEGSSSIVEIQCLEKASKEVVRRQVGWSVPGGDDALA
jgi:hypothetical protein